MMASNGFAGPMASNNTCDPLVKARGAKMY
jgi:hypothetical protein